MKEMMRVAVLAGSEDGQGWERFAASASPDAGAGSLSAVNYEYGGDRPVTAAEVAEIVREALAGLRVYVLESDITDAQNAVRAVVEKTVF